MSGKIVHYQADSLGRIYARRHGHTLALGQADEPGIAAADAKAKGRASDHLPPFQGGHSITQRIDHADNVLAEGERHARAPGERARAPEHEVVGRDTCGQDPDPDLAHLRVGKFLSYELQDVGPTVPRHDDSVVHFFR
jgi:hypothetical protein